jgi:hypothetical protein
MPVSNGSAGAARRTFTSSRVGRNLQGGGASREPFANVGSTNAHGREWLSGKTILPRVDTRKALDKKERSQYRSGTPSEEPAKEFGYSWPSPQLVRELLFRRLFSVMVESDYRGSTS